MRIILMTALLLMVAACTEQEESVIAVPLQQGLFHNSECQWSTAAEGRIDPCLCSAEIQAAHTGEKQLDARLTAEMESHLCPGTFRKGEVTDKQINQRSSSFEVTRDDEQLLSVVYTLEEVPAGAAHGRSWKKALIYDKQAKRWLEQNEIVPLGKRTEVANIILFHLLELNRTKYNGGLTLDEVSNYNLLTDYGCNKCVIYPVENGWKVVFEQYAVGPYVFGMVEVQLPEEDIGR